MASAPFQPLKRTGGVVNYSCARYGFIELTNKGLPISKVYFDAKSFSDNKKRDLSKEFPPGSHVSFTFVPTDGEHKVKYRAINIIKQKADRQTSHDGKDKKSRQKSHDGDTAAQVRLGKGCVNYLQKYLLNHGACELNELLQALIMQKDNCPNVLKSASVDMLVEFVNQNSNLFCIKHGFLCYSVLENEAVSFMDRSVQGGKFPLEGARSLLQTNAQLGFYLYGCGTWEDGAKDFITRHPERYVMWDNAIWNWEMFRQIPNLNDPFQKDLKAVKYYSDFALKKPQPVTSLSGHSAQAPANVKEVVKANVKDFLDFLRRNSFFFDINQHDIVTSKAYRIAVIDKCWKKKERKKDKEQRKKHQGKKAEHPQQEPWMGMGEVQKAFNDLSRQNEKLLNLKTSVPCSDEMESPQHYAFQSATPMNPMLLQSAMSGAGCATSTNSRLYASKEGKLFRKIIGDKMYMSVERKLLSMSLSSLNNLLLIRMNVGKRPAAKIYNGKEISTTTLEDAESVDLETIQKIVRSNNVVKSTAPLHYGIKGSLHSIKVIEQGGKMSGLTMFCQMHENLDGLGIDILERRKVTAVMCDPECLPLKYVHDYIRTKCRELSTANDVLVLDVDGQLSGCDEHAHSSLGDVTRITCAGSEDLLERMNDAIQHSHDYVVLIEADSLEILERIQKMCSKGIKVLAEIPVELKANVEAMFAL